MDTDPALLDEYSDLVPVILVDAEDDGPVVEEDRLLRDLTARSAPGGARSEPRATEASTSTAAEEHVRPWPQASQPWCAHAGLQPGQLLRRHRPAVQRRCKSRVPLPSGRRVHAWLILSGTGNGTLLDDITLVRCFFFCRGVEA